MAVSAGPSWACFSSSLPSVCKKQSGTSRQRILECHKCHLYQPRHHGISTGIIRRTSQMKFQRQLHPVCFANSDGLSGQYELDGDSENWNSNQDEDFDCDNGYLPTKKGQGKPGLISFYGYQHQRQEKAEISDLPKEPSNFLWFIGPTVLVASFVIPSLYMRKLVLLVFEDSLLTVQLRDPILSAFRWLVAFMFSILNFLDWAFSDFLILFFTEGLFYGGVAIFVLLIDRAWRPLHLSVPRIVEHHQMHFGLRISAVATLVLSLIIPFATMGMVWPWTGPAASATLTPYLVGLMVQFAFQQYARKQKSTAWPVIPVVFQVYRLHQLNRAAQLVTALSFSVRGAETTSQTLAINNSLGVLLNVLQLLGVICIWSLASFLMRFIPSSPINPDP